MSSITRRQFLRKLSALFAFQFILPEFRKINPIPQPQSQQFEVFVASLGTPVVNVQQVIAAAGGIQRFVDFDDVVVLKPNGQWPNQGYTNTECLKALIDVILARPGGFAGEIIIAEHVHRAPPPAADNALSTEYCWNMFAGNRLNNWPDMNYFQLVDDYKNRRIAIVTALPLYDSGQGEFDRVTGPSAVRTGRYGWVASSYTTSANGRRIQLSYPILRSSHSGNLVDLENGVWKDGSYTGQKVKLIFLPTLNNHSDYNHEDYAGPTSAIKCHLGIQDFNVSSGSYTLHGVGYTSPISPQAMGESVGQLITQLLKPAFYMTSAIYTGYRGRTDPLAAYTRTVGLCTDPVTLDYWMCKYVMYPIDRIQTFMNPDNNNNLRKALTGANLKGVGTIDETKMLVHRWFPPRDNRVFLPLIY